MKHGFVLQVGFVNSLKFSSDGLQLLAGVGQEHRLGRWWRLKEAKNSLVVISLSRENTEKNRQYDRKTTS